MEEKVEIIYEDKEILVVNKPSGLVVNRSNTYFGNTLQDWVEGKLMFTSNESDFSKRSGIVHRLDKDTSGILLIAKNEKSFIKLQKQFKKREVEKQYVCVVNGRVENGYLEINAPLGRNPNNPLKVAVVSGGRESHTLVEKIKEVKLEDNYFTILKIYPKTGRTHQIRVHLSAIRHPIVMDQIYCSNNLLKMNKKYFTRLMLHALKLSFFHPKSDKKVQFETDLPKAFNL